nr:oligoketide cyclase/lipid transport protein [uncultured Gammaproteobacteria bacterium]
MRKIHKSALVAYPAEWVFELVDDIESYPKFLPWCRAGRVLRREAEVVEAELEIARGALQQVFATRNFNRPGREIRMTLLHGPFKHLQGAWRFQPIGKKGSKITLDLEFETARGLGGLVFGAVFNQISETLVNAFIQRAKHLYG